MAQPAIAVLEAVCPGQDTGVVSRRDVRRRRSRRRSGQAEPRGAPLPSRTPSDGRVVLLRGTWGARDQCGFHPFWI